MSRPVLEFPTTVLGVWMAGLAIGFAPAPVAAQGLIVFDNRVQQTVIAPVHGPDPGAPFRVRHGNGPDGFPTGQESYLGSPLQGPGFTAQLFGGPTNAAVEELTPLHPSVPFREGPGAGFVLAPSFALPIPGIPETQRAQVQLRVWENRGGVITNWSQVLSNSSILRGQSRPFLSLPLGGFLLPPPNLAGLESFNLHLDESFEPPSLEIRRQGGPGQKGVELTFPWQTGWAYEVQFSTNFEAWEFLGEPVVRDDRTMEFIEPDTAVDRPRFYRLQLRPAVP